MERPRTSPRNLAHRMGRWSGLHPWRAILAWVAFVAICFAAGNAVGTTKVDETTSGPGESGHAARTLDQAGFNDQPSTELVFVQTRQGSLSDERPARRRPRRPRPPRAAHRTSARSARRSAPATAARRRSSSTSAARPTTRPRRSRRCWPPWRRSPRRIPACASSSSATRRRARPSTTSCRATSRRPRSLSIPITLLILIVAFGALMAAGIPVLLGLTSVFSAIGLAAVASSAIPTSEGAPILMMLIGMAVGVDYSLFYLKREREERARGLGTPGRARGRRGDQRPRGARLRHHGDGVAGRPVLHGRLPTRPRWRPARSSSSPSPCSAR